MARVYQVISQVDLFNWIETFAPVDPLAVILLGGERLMNTDVIIGALVDQVLVGVATLAFAGEGTDEPTIIAVYVEPEYRRQGIGRQLLTVAIAQMQAYRYNPIRVDILTDEGKALVNSLDSAYQRLLQINDNRLW